MSEDAAEYEKPAREPRNTMIQMRVTQTEYRSIRAAATKARRSVSDYCRVVMLDTVEQ